MKKAKVMLSALGICAVLATTFAFTAQKFTTKVVYTGTNANNCTNEVENRIITTTGSTLVFATTASSGANCAQTYTAIPAVD